MVAAALPIVGSLFNGITGKGAAKKAQQAQAQAAQAAIAEQRRQYDQTRSDNMPFLQAGQSAIGGENGILALLGLSGGDAQGKAIDLLKASPGFTSLYNTGQDTLLQNAAATGGLRGGDTQGGLAQFGSSLLASVIERQLANLGGLANMGAGTAGNLGALGQNTAAQVSGLLSNQGQSQASSILGQQAIQNNTVTDLIGLLTRKTGGGSSAYLPGSLSNVLGAGAAGGLGGALPNYTARGYPIQPKTW